VLPECRAALPPWVPVGEKHAARCLRIPHD